MRIHFYTRKIERVKWSFFLDFFEIIIRRLNYIKRQLDTDMPQLYQFDFLRVFSNENGYRVLFCNVFVQFRQTIPLSRNRFSIYTFFFCRSPFTFSRFISLICSVNALLHHHHHYHTHQNYNPFVWIEFGRKYHNDLVNAHTRARLQWHWKEKYLSTLLYYQHSNVERRSIKWDWWESCEALVISI